MIQNKTEMQRRIKVLEWTQLIMVICVIALLGAMLNLRAVATNDGRMPVKTTEYNFDSNSHFSYEEDFEVNSAHYSDRFHIGRFYISVGDVIIIVSAISVFIITGILMKGRYNERIHRKQNKRHRQKN